MGRSKKNKRRHQLNHPNQRKKRGRNERFWIEDCPDVSAEQMNDSSSHEAIVVDVLVTRVELEDDYRQQSHAEKPSATMFNNEQVSDTLKIVNLSSNPETDYCTGVQPTKPEKTYTTKSTLEGEDNNEKKNRKENVDSQKKSLGDEPLKTKKPALTSDNLTSHDKNSSKEITPPLICVKRTRSAKGKLQKFYSKENFKPLADGDCGDGIKNPYPKSEVADKFWSQRRRLFTRFDEGIQLDKESWFSVTPEAIANHIADRMVSGQERVTIIDMFCGCGGNAIAFALKKEVKLVVCVDTDVAKLKMAARNAKIYGITKEKMLFIHSGACKVLSCYNGGVRSNDINDINLNSNWGDFSSDFKFGELDLLPDSIEMAFISPPWGGMDYVKVGKRNYTLQCIQIEEESERMNGEVLLERAACALGHKATACFFPKNINGIAVGKSSHKAGFEGPVVMEQNILNGKLKTVTAYLGMS